MIIPVILSGGSGTRLWPLSTPEKPKQFVPLVSQKSLFQETLLRLDGIPGLAAPVLVCNEAHRFLVAEQLREIGAAAQAIVLEPEGRNTAPAIAVAAILATGPTATGSVVTGSEPVSASAEKGSDPLLLVLPADHVIADGEAFRSAVRRAVEAAEAGYLVTFGIVPTRAETGYGYIEQADEIAPGSDAAGWYAVRRFVEKPDGPTAERYVASGRFLWNSGMFVFGAATLLGELGRHAPAILAAAESASKAAIRDGDFTRLGREFLSSPSDSIDYALMERTDRAAVVPLDAGWSDVGSWAALYEALDKDSDGNAFTGDVVALHASGNLVRAGLRKIALLGVDNVAVIETDDTILIIRKDRSQDLRELLAAVKASTRSSKKQSPVR